MEARMKLQEEQDNFHHSTPWLTHRVSAHIVQTNHTVEYEPGTKHRRNENEEDSPSQEEDAEEVKTSKDGEADDEVDSRHQELPTKEAVVVFADQRRLDGEENLVQQRKEYKTHKLRKATIGEEAEVGRRSSGNNKNSSEDDEKSDDEEEAKLVWQTGKKLKLFTKSDKELTRASIRIKNRKSRRSKTINRSTTKRDEIE